MLNDPQTLKSLLAPVLKIAKQAGGAIMPFVTQPHQLKTRHKQDNTPVTEADIAAHHALVEGLISLTPDLPILSEEGDIPLFEERLPWKAYWLLDPLDGTRGFLQQSDEFSVNIALIIDHQPVLGVIYSPIQDQAFHAITGMGAYCETPDGQQIMHTTSLDLNRVRVLIGQYHSQKRLAMIVEGMPQVEVIRLNSSLKFTEIAAGKGDIYPRYGPTGEWDTAAGQIILQESGGIVVDLQGQPLHYNAKQSLINPPFVAIGDRNQAEAILHMLPKP